MDLNKLLANAVAWEKANSRKIAATLGAVVVKSAYGKALVSFLLSLLALQN